VRIVVVIAGGLLTIASAHSADRAFLRGALGPLKPAKPAITLRSHPKSGQRRSDLAAIRNPIDA
jgi:hypothetical protein